MLPQRARPDQGPPGRLLGPTSRDHLHSALSPVSASQLPMHIGSPEKCLMYVKSNLGQQASLRHSRASNRG